MTANNILLHPTRGYLFADAAWYSVTDWGRPTGIASKLYEVPKSGAVASVTGNTERLGELLNELAAIDGLPSLVEALPAVMARHQASVSRGR